MLYSLQNNKISVKIESLGAELSSIKSSIDGLEYLWQGDPTYWNRKAPILFPIIGTLPDNKYSYKGKEYTLTSHGFLRDFEFDFTKIADNEFNFKFTSNEVTFAIYPFNFEFMISYKLIENEIIIGHTVKNLSNEKMWFSVGEHPGFRCPLFENEIYEDYSLLFNKTENIQRTFLKDSLIDNKFEAFLDNENKVDLSAKLFDNLAIILKGLESDEITYKSKNHDRKVSVKFKNYPYLGIWAPKCGAPFVCIEPWYGIASKPSNSNDIRNKDGIMSLLEGQSFNCSYSITID